MAKPLRQLFFARDTLTVAKELVGCRLEVSAGNEVVSGRIVEVEAYGGEKDPASHAARGRTPRSEIMFGPAGIAYVYLIYGMYHCLNFVTEAEGVAGAVLIRAVEPLTGRDLMTERRKMNDRRASDRDLCAGPGRLCEALGIDINWNGLQLEPGLIAGITPEKRKIRVYRGEGPPGGPAATARIGIRKAVDWPHRFIDQASKCLSK